MQLKRAMMATVLSIGLGGSGLASDYDTIVESCHIQATIDSAACPCIADKVLDEFSEAELAFFLAVITNDQAAQAQAQGNMTVNELTHIGMRMNELPAECGSG